MANLPKKKRGPGVTREPVTEKARRLGVLIAELRERKGWNQKHLARLVGITQPSLSQIENGLTDPDNEKSHGNLRKIATRLGDTLGLPWMEQPNSVLIEGRVAGGRPIEFLEGDESIEVDSNYIRTTGDVTALKVAGDSMTDNHILDGDILICRKSPEPRKGQICVVDLKGQRGATVKRWERRGEMIYLYSDKNAKEDEKQAFHLWEVGKVFELLGLIRSVKR